MTTKFSRTNPRPECSALHGSKVMWGSARVSRSLICLEMFYGYQIWKEKLLIRAWGIAGVKVHAGVSQRQPEIDLLTNAPWLPYLF